MINEEIYTKYADALFVIGREDGQLHGQAVSLALRLAIADAYATGRASISGAGVGDGQRTNEYNQAQINTLNEWLAEHEPALYQWHTTTAESLLSAIQRRDAQIAELQQEIVKMDADEADIREDLAAARTELAQLMQERDSLRAELSAARQGWAAAQADADRLALQVAQQPIVIHSNGTGAAVAPTPAHDAAWWADLDSETNDYRISLEAGRRTFRQIPKERRLLLAQAVARRIGGGALPMQHEFDLGKPDWMPGGGGLVKSFGITWSELLDLREIAEP